MKIQEYLEKHLPPSKAESICDYLKVRDCTLKITRPRKTKRGDFRQYHNILRISVNHDDNSYRFLFTLIHEIAHLKTFIEHGNKVKPHGKVWKSNFKELFYLFDMESEFDRNEDLLMIVKEELENPKACSGVGIVLEKAFSAYDSEQVFHLNDIAEGAEFIFKGVRYKKLEDRRSRVMCLNVHNQKKYTISKAAGIEPC